MSYLEELLPEFRKGEVRRDEVTFYEDKENDWYNIFSLDNNNYYLHVDFNSKGFSTDKSSTKNWVWEYCSFSQVFLWGEKRWVEA